VKPDRRAGRVASAGDAAQELRTVRDCLRWAVSRFAAARIGTGHGTASLFDEAVAMALWSLHLPPDDLDRWLDARLARSEREALIALIERRCTERVPPPTSRARPGFAACAFEATRAHWFRAH